MVGMFVCLCLASQNPFKQEFLVPVRTDLGVKLLNGRFCSGRKMFCQFILSHQIARDKHWEVVLGQAGGGPGRAGLSCQAGSLYIC